MFKVELKADPWWIKLAFTALIYFSENVLKHQSLLNTKPAPGPHFKINTSPSYLTNREALTVLCSVIKQAGSG